MHNRLGFGEGIDRGKISIMNNLFKSLFITIFIFASYSAQSASNCKAPLEINMKWKGVDVAALEKVIDDAQAINSTLHTDNTCNYESSSITGTLNGHTVKIYSIDHTNLGKLSAIKVIDSDTKGKITKKTRLVLFSGLSTKQMTMEIDGVKILDSNKALTIQEAVDLARTLGIVPTLDTMTSSSLSSTSPSSVSSQIVYNVLDVAVQSHKQQADRQRAAKRNLPSKGFNFAIGDIKYEQARYTNNNNDGNIVGAMMSISTEIAGVELGAYIPYDYMNFDSFKAHRAGTVVYAKRDWQLPKNIQLTTMANFNYIATYVSSLSLTNTVGGGFGTSLKYDNGGDFIPRISFALQDNTDIYYQANDYIQDQYQVLMITGGSLGYRLFENSTLQAGFTYTRDITDYKSYFNKIKDDDYFDISVGGSYSVSDMWQVNLNYKRILGLETYYSNTFFLGTTIWF